MATLSEGALLAILLEKMTGIKKEFSMVSELKWFSITLLFLTNLALFFVIQGPFSDFFTKDTQDHAI